MPSEPVFVRSTYPYVAYTDFWRLVELSGFRSLPAAEVNLAQPGVYIWPSMDMEFIERLSAQPPGKREATVIFWNLERPDERPGINYVELFRRGMSEILQWADGIWISEESLHVADPRTQLVMLGGHPGLAEAGLEPPVFDVAHFGRLTPRRQSMVELLGQRGLKVTGNAWGPEREKMLASSRLLLNIDRVEGLHLAPPLRWVLGAAYRIPNFTEALLSTFPLKDGISILSEPYLLLPDSIGRALKDPDLLHAVGDEGWNVLCRDWTFRRGVEEGLKKSPCVKARGN